MADFLLQAILSNLIVSLLLVVIALILQRRYQAVVLANIIWVMVLVKLLTPPLISLPLLEVESVANSTPASMFGEGGRGDRLLLSPTSSDLETLDNHGASLQGVSMLGQSDGDPSSVFYRVSFFAVGALWISVSACLVGFSIYRITCFQFYLRRQALVPEPELLKLGDSIAKEIGLRRTPLIVAISSNISPFVWWSGGRPCIFLSRRSTDELSPAEMRMILAHEMAHISRLDHWVRWVEWLATSLLWWNPVMWLARTQLRITEEIACDALVMTMADVKKFDYANTLVNMAEILTTQVIRPPAVVSEFNSGGVLEKRLNMIISNEGQSITHGAKMLIVAMAICVFPFGLVYAQDYEAVQRRLVEAVKAGELSREQVRPMMEALEKNAKSSRESGARDQESLRQRYMQGERRIKAAIESGDVTKEEGESRLAEMRQRMFPSRDKGDAKSDRKGVAEGMEVAKRRFKAAAEEIEAAVEAGKMSKSDARQKLTEMRQRMFPSRDKGDAKSDRKGVAEEMEVAKRRFKAAAEEIEAAVEAGKISKKEAKRKLTEMREKMSDK